MHIQECSRPFLGNGCQRAFTKHVWYLASGVCCTATGLSKSTTV